METFKLNGRTYKAKEIDFNFVSMLGENGIALTEITKKVLPSIRVYVAYCMNGAELEMAGNEINMHVLNGGTLDDISKVFVEKMNESDFFRALNSKEEPEKETTATSGKGTKKNQKEQEASE